MAEQRTKIIIETDAGRSEQVLRSVQNGLKGVGSEADKAGRGVKSGTSLMDSSFASTAVAAAAMGAAISAAFSMAKEAAELSEARLLLQTFGAQIGVSYDKLDQATKKATGGMVENLTLIRANHKALRLGVTNDVDELSRLWEISQSVGDEFGQSIEQTFEQITDAISKGNAKSLISLGILPESFKKASGAAGLLEQRVKLLEAVMKSGGASAEALSGVGNTSADTFDRFTAATKNLANTFGESLLPIVGPVIEIIIELENALAGVISKFGQLADLSGSKNPFLGKTLEEMKALRDSTNSRIISLDMQQDSLSRPSSQGGTAGQYTEGARQNAIIQLAGERQALQQIDAAIAGLEVKTKARAEVQKVVVAATKEEGAAKVKVTDAQKALNKAEEESAKLIAQASEAFIEGFGVKTIGNLKEAESLLTSMTAAAGGFAIGLKDGTTEAGKLLEESEKISKKFEELNTNIVSTLSGAGRNWSKELAGLSPENAATGMMNFMSGGLFSATGDSTKDALKDIKEPLSKTIAEAVQAGFANADFSDLSRTLGDILGSVLSRSVAQSNPIMDAAGSISFGNLGINLAADLAVKALTQPGRFFGGREEHGTEAIQQAATLKDKVSNAYTSSFLSEIGSVYASQDQRDAIRNARNGLIGTSTGTTWNDSGNGVTSDRTRTYALIDNGASAALKTLNDAVSRAEMSNSNAESAYKLKAAEGYDYSVLSDQVDIFKAALNSVYFGSRELNWSDGSKSSSVDLTAATREIQTTLAEMVRELGTATAARTNAISQGYTKYAPWMNSSETPGNQYDSFSSMQTNFMDRNITPEMLDMVKQSGAGKYDLEKLRATGSEDYAEKYLEYVEKQVAAFEEVMKRQEEIFNDATKTFEERSAALATFESAQEAFYQGKLDALAAEQAAEEAIKAKELEASARRADGMEAALSLVGEISQRGDKIVILQGGDSASAINDMLEQFKDNPEVVTVLQAALVTAEAKAKWGK